MCHWFLVSSVNLNQRILISTGKSRWKCDPGRTTVIVTHKTLGPYTLLVKLFTHLSFYFCCINLLFDKNIFSVFLSNFNVLSYLLFQCPTSYCYWSSFVNLRHVLHIIYSLYTYAYYVHTYTHTCIHSIHV